MSISATSSVSISWQSVDFVVNVLTCFRLYDIACDAELQEKSKADLVRVTNLVIDRCQQTVANYEVQAGDGVQLSASVSGCI